MDDRSARASDELRPYVDRAEAEGLDRVAARLQSAHPVPRDAGFRAELRAHLISFERSHVKSAWRPKRLRLAVAAYLGSGLALLAIAGLGLAGSGPLA